mgnify:CR=1 FL=1
MKSKLLSIVIVVLFGFLGIHRFYLNKPNIGFVLLGLFISFFTLMLMSINNVAVILLLVLILWWLYEIFLVLSGKLKAELVSEIRTKPKETESQISTSSQDNEPKGTLQLNCFEEVLITMEKANQKREIKEDSKKLDIILFDEKKRKQNNSDDQGFKLFNFFSDEVGKKWLAENQGKLFFQESGTQLLHEEAIDQIDVRMSFAHVEELNPEVKDLIWGKKKPGGEDQSELLMHIEMISNFGFDKQPSLFDTEVAPKANQDDWWEWLDDCNSELFHEYLQKRVEESNDKALIEYFEDIGCSPNVAIRVYTFNGKVLGKYSWQGGRDILIDTDSKIDFTKFLVVQKYSNNFPLVDFNYGYSVHKIKDFKQLDDKAIRNVFLDLEETRSSNPAIMFDKKQSSKEIFKLFNNDKTSGVNTNLLLTEFFLNPISTFGEAQLVYKKLNLDNQSLMAVYFHIYENAHYFETEINQGIKNEKFIFTEMLMQNNKLPIKLNNECNSRNIIVLSSPAIELDYANEKSNQGIAIITNKYCFAWEFKQGTDHFNLENYESIKSILNII